jgi:acetyl esterase/lipase
VYQPAEQTEAPAAVLLHGCCGDRADLEQLAYALARAGVLVFNASWTTLENGGGWPRSYQEAACAVAYARQYASAVGSDPNRVVLVGWSDGALLASVVGFGGNPLSDGCEAGGSGRPDAVVALGGYFGGASREDVQQNERQMRFLAGLSAGLPGDPHTYLPLVETVPTWLVTGTRDNLLGNAQAWHGLLAAAGAEVVMVEEWGSHLDVISPRTPLGAEAVAAIRRAAGLVRDD